MELFYRNWFLPLSNKFFGNLAYKQMDIIIRESDNINYQSFISMKEHIDRHFVFNFLITHNNSFMKSFYYFKYIFLLLSYFFAINAVTPSS
jgi:hypothetical protein